MFETIQKEDDVYFHEGLPCLSDLNVQFGQQGGGVLVFDDSMDEEGRDKSVLDLFTKHSHHRNITVFYLSQDMFPPGSH